MSGVLPFVTRCQPIEINPYQVIYEVGSSNVMTR
jgi:hypothetical protein